MGRTSSGPIKDASYGEADAVLLSLGYLWGGAEQLPPPALCSDVFPPLLPTAFTQGEPVQPPHCCQNHRQQAVRPKARGGAVHHPLFGGLLL